MPQIMIDVTGGEHSELKGFAAALRQPMSRLFRLELIRMLERFKKDRKADPSSLALERKIAGFARYEALLSSLGCASFQELCDDFSETAQEAVHLGKENEKLEKRITELEAELAAVYEKTGENFEKVRFLEESPEGSKQ